MIPNNEALLQKFGHFWGYSVIYDRKFFLCQLQLAYNTV